MIPVPEFIKNKPNWRGNIYIKDPIGKFYYRADPTGVELQNYRENIGASSFRYTDMVKGEFLDTWRDIEERVSFGDIMSWKTHLSSTPPITAATTVAATAKPAEPAEPAGLCHEGAEWPVMGKGSPQSIVNMNIEEVEEMLSEEKPPLGGPAPIAQKPTQFQATPPAPRPLPSSSLSSSSQLNASSSLSSAILLPCSAPPKPQSKPKLPPPLSASSKAIKKQAHHHAINDASSKPKDGASSLARGAQTAPVSPPFERRSAKLLSKKSKGGHSATLYEK